MADKLGYLKAEYLRSHGVEKLRLTDEIKTAESELRSALGDAAAPEGVADWARPVRRGVSLGAALTSRSPIRPMCAKRQSRPPPRKRSPRNISGRRRQALRPVLLLLRPRAGAAARGRHPRLIRSNSWLDVGYGAKLQRYLLDNAHIRAIYESAVERQFSTAAINTIISIARKGKPADSAETKFVQLLYEFDKATAPGGKRRVISKNRRPTARRRH